MTNRREYSINLFRDLLLSVNYDLDKLVNKYDLYVHRHDIKPIAILNYGRNFNQNHDVLNACRGLIINTSFAENGFKVISRGFDRFVPMHIKMNEQISVRRATVKEDGSLIFMFKMDKKWHLSTMHNFADDKVSFSDMTYEQLFLEIIDQDLDIFGDNLLQSCCNISEEYQQVKTFCFEMCSLQNRVIRKYNTPTLYLLAMFGGEYGSVEFTVPPIKFESVNVKHVTEIELPGKITMKQASDIVKKYSSEHDTMLFEGFVLQTEDNRRIKVKNPWYLIHHKLKYRGWIKFDSEIAIPLILDHLDDIIISNVIESMGGNIHVQNELLKRAAFYKNKIREEYEKIKAFLNNISIHDISKRDYISKIQNNNPWKPLLISLYDNPKDLDNLWKKHCMQYGKQLFSIPFVDSDHDLLGCELKSIIEGKNDGLASEHGKCFCGMNMKIIRLRYDLHSYKVCHCGTQYGIITYTSGSYLCVCTDELCDCTHEVNQKTLLPLGIPASNYCKSLRLYIHDLMRLRPDLTKSQCYERISQITGRTPEDTHMAKMGIQDCIKVIKNFR